MGTIPRVLQEKPYIAVDFEESTRKSQERIVSIGFMAGRIAVHEEAIPLPARQSTCMILASLGISDKEIGEFHYTTRNTVKTNLRLAFNRIGLPSRAAFARHALEKGFYTIERPSELLTATPTQLAIANYVSFGMTRVETAEALGISPNTVESHLLMLTTVNKLHGQEMVVMGSLLSGQIGDFVVSAAEPDTNDLEFIPVGESLPA